MGIFGGSTAGQPRYDGRMHNLQISEAVFGTCATIAFGTVRLHQKLLFYGGFYAVTAPNSGGKGLFGGKTTEWDYYADANMLMAQSAYSQACHGILNVWDSSGKLQNESVSFAYTIPSGGGTVVPQTSPAIAMNLGVSKSVTYSVTTTSYGSGGPITLSGTQSVPLQLVTGTPGAGQYAFNPATGAYTFSAADVGASLSLFYSCVFSLYYLEQTQGAQVPATSPYQVSTNQQAYFLSDNGVVQVDTGIATQRVLVAGTDYTESAGVYTFGPSLAGALVYISYTYTSSDASLTNSSSLNLTFFNGAPGQAPWSYMTSKYPGAAFGYSGLCYIGANPLSLGMSGALPSYNYELVGLVPFGGGILDAHPCDAFYLLLTDEFIGCGFPVANIGSWTNCYAYWAAFSYFISKAIDTQSSVSDILREVIETGNVGAVWSGGLLKLIPYGDTAAVGNGYTFIPPTTPVATLSWDDLLSESEASKGRATRGDPLQVLVKAPQDCMNYVQVQWVNRENDYNNEITPEQNDAFIAQYGFRPEAPLTWNFITTQAAASWALSLRLKRNCYIRNTYKLWLPFWFSALEPMDMIVLPTGEPVRITQIEDDPNGRLAIEAEQWGYGTGDVTLYPKQASSSFQPSQSQALPGDATPVFVQNTAQQNAGGFNIVQIAASGQNANWGGCNVLVSLDGLSYTNLGPVKEPAVIGQLSSALATGFDPDPINTLSVDITIGAGGNVGSQLSTVTQQQADQLGSLCAIIDIGGVTNELIAYETATQTAPNRYSLTYLRRGAYGTPIAAHSAGAQFVYLGTGYTFLNYQYSIQDVGRPLYVKLQSFNLMGNQLQALAQCTVWTMVLGVQGCNIVETYSPSANAVVNTGAATVVNPADAYDKNFATPAIFDSGAPGGGSASCTYSGFSGGVTTAPMTLYISYTNQTVSPAPIGSAYTEIVWTQTGGGGPVGSIIFKNTTSVPPVSGTVPVSIPKGTDLSLLNVLVWAVAGGGYLAHIEINEIWIQ